MSRKIVKARRIMREAFDADPDFRRVYEANIAMLIYDDQVARREKTRRAVITNLGTKEGCNNIADRILTLIFSKDS